MNWCQINNDKYTDHDFSTSLLSLTHLTTQSTKYKNWIKYTWRRISEVSTDIEIFKDTLSPLDIIQGALGDCNFLCALSILCEYPGLLQNIFITKKQNSFGVYSVKLCIDGMWKIVNIDDFFPCGPNGMPVFSQCVKGEIWVMILEKVWAKRCGSYENTEKCDLACCLRDLTGAPTRVLAAEQGVWDDLVHCKEIGCIIAASAGNTKSSHTLLETVGLIGNISYAVLKTADVGEKIVQLRNPWSKVEWNGDWSDNSPKWTSRLKKKLNHENADDGTFWMSFSDFCEYFSQISICEYLPSSVYSSLLLSHEIGECIIIDLEIQKSGDYVLSLNQKDKIFQDTLGNYNYSQVRLVVCREGRRGIEHSFGKRGNDREVWARLALRRGNYKVLVLADWVCDEREMVISSYGPEEVIFKSSLTDLSVLEQLYMKKAEDVPPVDYAKSGIPGVCKYHEFLPEGFGYIYIKNSSETTILKEKTYFKVFKNLKLLPPFKDSSYEIIVKPGQGCFILIKVVGEGEFRLESSSTFEKLN